MIQKVYTKLEGGGLTYQTRVDTEIHPVGTYY